MRLSLLLISCCSLLLAWAVAYDTSAEDSTFEATYLEEPGPVPPLKKVQEHVLKEKYKNDNLRLERSVIRFSDDSLINHGAYAEFYRDGTPFCKGEYKQGVTVGVWKYWHPNGQFCKEVTYKEGLPDGTWKVFRADGTLQASKKYVDGSRDGEWTLYFEDGKQPRLEVHYLHGLLEGTRTSYHKNGQMSQQATLKKNRLEGTMTKWDDTGKKILVGTFVDNELQGQFQRWQSERPKEKAGAKNVTEGDLNVDSAATESSE